MERYAAGEDAVFERLYRSLAPRLYRFCLRLAGRPAEADDCFQETFLRLHRARASFMTGANVLHWAYAIARSVYLSRLRYARRRPEDIGILNDIGESEGILPKEGASPEAHALAEDMLDVVANELAGMSETIRSAYVLLKEEELSAKEAAAVLGTTPDAVKQRAHRAYVQLRAALESAGWRSDGRAST